MPPSESKQGVRRVLRWYGKDRRKSPHGECALSDLDLGDLQALFGSQPEDPLYHACYPVTAEHVGYLRIFTTAAIDFQAFDYFVEAEKP